MTVIDPTYQTWTQDPAPAQRPWDRRTLSATAGHNVVAHSSLATEGQRGRSVRATIYLRHVTYLLVILICSGATQKMLSTTPSVNNGGMWMLFSATLILLTGAVGGLFYRNHRNEIIEQARHFLFGISLLPGTGIAVLMWATRGVMSSSAASSSVLTTAFQNALPLLFFATVIIPALIFVKVIAGMRNLHRSRLDDQEAMSLWTRQDRYVR